MIGNILRNMRLTARLSQKKLGNILNLADTTISSYERENSQATFDTILKIAKICNYDILFKDTNGNIIIVDELSKEKDF